MTISDNKVVSLSYVLRVDGPEGKMIETVTEDKPLQFVFGIGHLLPKFEQNIAGLKVGDDFSFLLEAKDAYGEAVEDLVVDVPRAAFRNSDGTTNDDILFVNNVIPMMDSQGHHLQGLVVEVKDDAVTMDFNHPLAGDNLYFTGKVTAIREATPEELSAGVHHGCGCGCDHDDCNCEEGDCGCGGCH